MIELIKKYAALLIVGSILSRLLTAIILYIFPNLLALELPDGNITTLGSGYLHSGIEYLINVGFIILLVKDMKREQMKSSLILIMTFFSSFTGVLLFLLTLASNRFNQSNTEVYE